MRYMLICLNMHEVKRLKSLFGSDAFEENMQNFHMPHNSSPFYVGFISF